ncbi:uncharacterized protein (DUF1800 family) [Paraburkholderia youngii]|uniref:hypothetical protein n=1 Tax=Paraburkholderia youngii TaxID=2782701 RepID=UPI003D251240
MIGALRAFDVGCDDTSRFVAPIRAFRANLFYPPNAKRWLGGASRINSSTLLAHKQFVEQLFRATRSAAAPRMNSAASACLESGAPAAAARHGAQGPGWRTL